MDIQEFFSQCAGKWFVQRTNYQLATGKSESGKSDLLVEVLAPEDTTVVNLAQQGNFAPQLAWGGLKTSWDNSVDWGKPKKKGLMLIVPIPDQQDSHQGKLVCQKDQEQLLLGEYFLGQDEALTLRGKNELFSWEERIWFASPNLRMRHTLVKNATNFCSTSFYSEIRRVSDS